MKLQMEKRSLIWFIFPQIKGLGHSEICKCLEIQSLQEAEEYLKNIYL